MNLPIAPPIVLAETGAGIDRSKFLGASSVAAIMGLSKWATPLQVYEEKIGIRPPDPSEAKQRLFARGHRWEAVVLDMLLIELRARGHDVAVIHTNRRFAVEAQPFLQCEIDAELMLDGEVVNCEVKTVHPFAADEWGEGDTDEVPIYYSSQAMQGLGITQRRLCIVAALFGADYIVPYFVERDDETISAMMQRGIAFWINNVLARVPPDPVNVEDMLRIFAKKNGRPAEVDDETAQAIADLKAIKSRIKAYEGDEEAVKFRVLDGVRRAWNLIPGEVPTDNAIILHHGVQLASWKRQTSEKIDVGELRRKHPAVAEEVTTTSTTRVLRLK